MNEALGYKEAVKRSHKEALYALLSAVFLCIFFWGAIFLTADSDAAFYGLPIWFWLSCLGGYVLSVVVVWVLVKKIFCNFSLTAKDEDEEP